MRICTICNKEKEEKDFAFKNVSRAIRMSECRVCRREKYVKSWQSKHKDRVKQAQLKYRERNQEVVSLKKKLKRLENIDLNRKIDREMAAKKRSDSEYKNRQAEWRKRNSDGLKEKRLAIRKSVLEYYGGRCACCGETEPAFLSIDHIDGGGNAHRKVMKGRNIYSWLKGNSYPKGFQILCHNCNQAKGFYGKCPHKC